MKGTNSGNQLGVYGVIGSAAIGNNPGGRENSIFWKDASGNFWIFGGYGVDFIGNTSYLSDLWKYNQQIYGYGKKGAILLIRLVCMVA